MTLSPKSLGRGLATVRYLYELAIQLSRHGGLRRGAAILAFHDAVEMFLVLALQHHDMYTQRRLYHFHEYWGELATADPPVRMTQQSTMETLNRARVNFKHHAIPPDATVVEDARVHVRDFLIENTSIVFDMSFHDISLASALSAFERTRAYLQESESVMASGQYDDALGRIAFAFALLMIDCGATRDPGGSLVSPYEPSTFSSLRLNLDLANRGGPSLPKPISDHLASFADNVCNRIISIEITLRLLGLGIDYERYVRFSELTPLIASHGHEDPRGWGLAVRHTERPATLDDCRFCFAFVIDSALRLQEAVRQTEA